MNCGIPHARADYARRPPRPGKLVEPVLVEEGCRMWDTVGSSSGGDRQLFPPKMEPTWDALDLVAAGCNALRRGA